MGSFHHQNRMFEHQAGAELLRNVDRQQLCKVRQAVLAYQGCDAEYGLRYVSEQRSSLSYYYDQFFPLLIMYMPRAASPPAKAYFKWNVSPRHRHEVIAPTTGISEL